MKKTLLLLVLSFVFAFAFSSIATATTTSNLTDYQINQLEKYGASVEQIRTMTKEEAVEFIAQQKHPVAKRSITNEISSSNDKIYQSLSDIYGEGMVNAMINRGYNLEDIKKSIDQIPFLRASYNPPSSYGAYTQDMPYLGGMGTTYFHPNVSVNVFKMYDVCEAALRSAEKIFSTTYNYGQTTSAQNLRFSYNIYGEFDESNNVTHEGIDLRKNTSSAASVKSLTKGNVLANYNSTWGAVFVYDSNNAITMTYYHLSNITSTAQTKGNTISVGTTLGNQGTQGLGSGYTAHVHIQTADGKDSAIFSNTGATLESIQPVFFLDANV